MRDRAAGRSREREAQRGVPRWRARLTAVLLAAAVWGGAGAAWAQRPSQDEVEAAYLYNFGKFVRWPEAKGQEPLRICVAGPDAFEQTLSRLVAGEQIQDRPLEVKKAGRPDEVAGCSILFLGVMDEAQEEAYLAATAGKPVLTVGEGRDFLARGGMIQFVPVEDHVRFAVNLDAANKGRVGLSSELLKVAVSVTGRPGKAGTGGPP